MWGGSVLIVWVKPTQKTLGLPLLAEVAGFPVLRIDPLSSGVCSGHFVHPSLPCFVRFQKKPGSKDRSFTSCFHTIEGQPPSNMGRA